MKRIFSLFFFALTILSFNADAQYRRIVSLAGTGGIGGYGGDGFSSTGATFNSPQDVALDKSGNVYIVDFNNYRVRKIKKSTGMIQTFAGNGTYGYTGDNTDATTAELCPRGVAADFRGNVFISDAVHHVIRRVNTLGIISTYAGTGAAGYTRDGFAATTAKLNTPFGITCDKSGNLYIADAGNHAIRMVDTFGVISTVAGTGLPGLPASGIPAISTPLDSPYAVAVSGKGELFIADHQNNVVRKVDLLGDIYTFAGTGVVGYAGDGGLAVAASLNYPKGVAVDSEGNVYIADSYNNVIRMVDTFLKVSTFAGNSFAGFGGDLGSPTGANLFHPHGVAVDSFGSVYIADVNNQRIRKVYITTLGVDDVTNASDIAAYPNPFSNTISVSGLNKADKVCLYDLVGKPVSETWTVKGAGEQAFEIGDLAQGMYFLQVNDANGNKKTTIKMIR